MNNRTTKILSTTANGIYMKLQSHKEMRDLTRQKKKKFEERVVENFIKIMKNIKSRIKETQKISN